MDLGTYSAGDEIGVVAMGGVPVSAVEYADNISVYGWEGLIVANEAMFIVDLKAYVVSRYS